MRMRTRAAGALAAGAALSLMGSTVASAHHCYKVDWQERAYENLAANGTAWMTISDLGAMFLLTPGEEATCRPVLDQAVAEWMVLEDFDREPLIHSKATIGGGAYHRAGKNPPPIGFLTDAQFGSLMGLAVPALMGAGCELPPEPE